HARARGSTRPRDPAAGRCGEPPAAGPRWPPAAPPSRPSSRRRRRRPPGPRRSVATRSARPDRRTAPPRERRRARRPAATRRSRAPRSLRRVARPDLPSFDLVVATVDRTVELDRLFASLERQTHRLFRVVLVDQNDDDRLSSVLAQHPGVDVLHVRSERGLSRARNRALRDLRAEVVGFPDDDCSYADDLLERVAETLSAEPTLEGLTGRVVTPDGTASSSWESDSAILTDDNLWN